MRSEIGKLSLDNLFQERQSLNDAVRNALNDATQKWGIDCMRYEIKDIKPPNKIKEAMQAESESERNKRSIIIQSEGEKLSKINRAQGDKQEQIFEGQASAEEILLEAQALVESIKQIGNSIKDEDGNIGKNATQLKITENYLKALQEIYSKVKIIGLPVGAGEANSNGSMSSQFTESLATALVMSKHVNGGE